MPSLNRRGFLKKSVLAASVISLGPFRSPALLRAEPGFKFDPSEPLIQAPNDPALWEGFRQQLNAWREQKRRELNYSDALYRRADFNWVPASFACCFLML